MNAGILKFIRCRKLLIHDQKQPHRPVKRRKNQLLYRKQLKNHRHHHRMSTKLIANIVIYASQHRFG